MMFESAAVIGGGGGIEACVYISCKQLFSLLISLLRNR